MPLYILAPMVVVGLALVIGCGYLLDRKKSRKPLDEAGFRKRFARDFPNEEVDEIILASDGLSALLRLASAGKVGLVFQMGQNQSTRLLEPGSVQHISQTAAGLELVLKDFSAHCVKIELKDPAKTLRLLSWFKAFEVS